MVRSDGDKADNIGILVIKNSTTIARYVDAPAAGVYSVQRVIF